NLLLFLVEGPAVQEARVSIAETDKNRLDRLVRIIERFQFAVVSVLPPRPILVVVGGVIKVVANQLPDLPIELLRLERFGCLICCQRGRRRKRWRNGKSYQTDERQCGAERATRPHIQS